MAEKETELSERIGREVNDILIKVGVTPVRKVVLVADASCPEGLLRWTYELTRNSWMTDAMERRFLNVASDAGGV
ncbi:hypothetical protein ACW9YQ_17890 (plasmid) [Paraburkholderia strydomiana]